MWLRMALIRACRALIRSPKSLLPGLGLTSTLALPPAALLLLLLSSLLLLAARLFRRLELRLTCPLFLDPSSESDTVELPELPD